MSLHFIKLRKIWYIISLVIILPGLISLAVQGLNKGIDFTGGNIIEISYDKPVAVETIRNTISSRKIGGSHAVQKIGETGYLIRTPHLTQDQNDDLLGALGKLGKSTILRNESVGAIIGRELTQKALIALIIASVLMIIYITVRFEFKQGLAAIIALLHDVLVVTGIFSLFRIEIDSAFVAAILTIIGYSINDTIIIFDRIRENMLHRQKGESIEDVVNRGLWQTLTRSINTVLTVIFVLVAMYFLGGSTIKTFVLAMLIGVVSGMYSSICNASPLWIDLKRLEKKSH
ncbi:MAG TPA: protein translocase subunit SecF [Desulfotomaculum sp.]|nr:MAG: Protein-export membrane protein SecF [Desulfotomaculum sp. 46_80]KUK85181.1 MAG: Protein-export membrane protein SecF [Desulfofundulus kuznetsovii]HAG12200.1 protein translocase subunit SecF [Desulfotomaculum sp.]HBY04404.1 protein translocase subunit SecF [Desulfotomaculum sp.]